LGGPKGRASSASMTWSGCPTLEGHGAIAQLGERLLCNRPGERAVGPDSSVFIGCSDVRPAILMRRDWVRSGVVWAAKGDCCPIERA